MIRPVQRAAAAVALTLLTGGIVSLGTAAPARAASGSDPAADLYIVGQYNSTLLKIAAGGGETNLGSGLSDPYQIFLAHDRALYIADAGNNRIVRISSGGSQTDAVTGLSYPNAVAVASNDTIYVGQGNQLLKVVNGVQTTITVAGGVTPYGLAVDPDDNVYASDYTRNRVIKVTSAGVVSVFATGIAFPTGIVADNDGNVFVTSATAYSVYKITPDGTKTTFATGIQYSWGLGIDGAGNLYASSNGSSSVYKMAPTFPGGNATAIVTGLNSPIGLVVSSPPPPPTDVTGVAGDTKVTVSWTASATHGGPPVTNYRVTADPGNLTCTTSSSSCEITGLVNGQAYRFTVEAQNAVHNGWSAASGQSDPVSPLSPNPPAAPASLTVQPGDGKLDLSFPPANGGVILRHEVSVDNGPWTTLPTTGTNPLLGTVTGLTNGTTYGIRVRGVNAIGNGTEVGPENGTPRTVPDAPTLQSAQRGDTSAELTLVPPTGDGGSPVTGYEYSVDGGTNWATLTTTAGTGGTRVGTVTGLINGTPYTFLVRAVNAAGGGSPSTGQTATPAAAPGAPTLAPPVPGSGTLQLTVTPGTDGGDAVTGYQVSTDDGTTWATLTTTAGNGGTRVGTVSALANGTTYQVRVRAQNGIGPGTASAAQAGVPSTTPGQPTGLAVEAGDTTATVTFTPPAANGGNTISGYQYSVDGTTWTTVSTTAGTGATRVATITGLTNGTTYPVRVRAVNDRGAGSGSDPTDVVPGTPLRPTDVIATADTSSVDVSWTASATNGLPITRYVATAAPGPATCTAVAPATSCVLGGEAGTVYTVTVVAYAGDFASPPSLASNSATPSEPTVPTTPPTTTLLLTTDKGDITAAAPGEDLVVFGEGFAPYSTVKITIYSDPVVLGTVVTDGFGKFSKAVTVPTGLGAGTHSFIAAGVDTFGNPYAMKLVVTVSAAGLAVTGVPVVPLALTGTAWLFAGITLCALAGWLRRPDRSR